MIVGLRVVAGVSVARGRYGRISGATNALFIVTLSEYAGPKTNWCQSVARMLSMMEVGLSAMAMA